VEIQPTVEAVERTQEGKQDKKQKKKNIRIAAKGTVLHLEFTEKD